LESIQHNSLKLGESGFGSTRIEKLHKFVVKCIALIRYNQQKVLHMS